MKKLISNGLMIAGMLSVPVAVTNTEVVGAAAEYENDPRLETLKKFFQKGDCPVRDLSAEFLKAVAEFFETDAEDLLSELGYVPGEAVVTDSELSR